MRIVAVLGVAFFAVLPACASPVEDHTVGKPAGTCELHQVRMQKAKVPIEYGLPIPMPDRQYEQLTQARETLFPHGAEPVSGGCCVSDDMALHAWIWACPQCTAAMRRWRAEHPVER